MYREGAFYYDCKSGDLPRSYFAVFLGHMEEEQFFEVPFFFGALFLEVFLMKKIMAILLSALLIVSVFTIAVSAQSNTVSVRIEGVNENFYYGDVPLGEDDTVMSILNRIDADNESITVVSEKSSYDGSDYVTAINGEKAATFGGYDGWQYAVNNVYAEVGMGSYKPSAGDKIVILYGDYPCALPVADFSKANEGVISFASENTNWVPDENGNYNPVTTVDPVSDADVFLNGEKFTTDKDGKISFNASEFKGFVNVQISRYSKSGAPSVCRYAPDYGFEMKGATTDESTPEETTAPVTVPETTQATEPTTSPATEPTTAPATEPTTAPATEPTTAPATEPTTAPATEPTTSPATDAVKVTTVSLPSAKTLYVQGTYTISANAINNPVGKTNYSSSNPKVVSVIGGKLTALKKGTANITVTNNNIKGTMTVTVKNPKLNKKSVTLKLKKGKKTFKIKVKGQVGKLSFKSSKKKVAKVSSKGVVTAKKKGKAVITVSTNGMKLKLNVKVK